MIRFTAIRLTEIAVLLALMSFVIYALIGLMPGDPIDLMRSADPRMSADDVTRLKELYGVDRPLFARYLVWAGQALGGEFGYSRLFAARRPKEVEGLVFVDSSVEHQTQRLQTLFGPNAGSLDGLQRRVLKCLRLTSQPTTPADDPELLSCAQADIVLLAAGREA